MSERVKPWGAVKLGPVGNVVLVMALPIFFIVATIGSALTMLFGGKK